MSDDEEPVGLGSDRLPLYTLWDRRAYLRAYDVAHFLRALASACRANADNPDCGLLEVAAAIDNEADGIDVRAIAHTKR